MCDSGGPGPQRECVSTFSHLTDNTACHILFRADTIVCRMRVLGGKMATTISNSAYAILRTLVARGRRVVTTTEIREAVGFDPHPMLGRDIVGRRWADPWDSITPEKRGVQITALGEAAFELGRLERGDAMPAQVGAPIIRTGKARDVEWWDARVNRGAPDIDPEGSK